MAQKKERAFFICPRWNEVAGAARGIRVHEKSLAAIKAGQPVARSTLHRALVAVRQATGAMFDVNALIVDQRMVKPR